jgi:hypothetical protein
MKGVAAVEVKKQTSLKWHKMTRKKALLTQEMSRKKVCTYY